MAHRHKLVPIRGLEHFPQRLCKCGKVQVAANGNNLEIKAKGDASLGVDWYITGGVTIFTPPV